MAEKYRGETCRFFYKEDGGLIDRGQKKADIPTFRRGADLGREIAQKMD